MHPDHPAVAPVVDQVGGTQGVEVGGQGRGGDVEPLAQLADGQAVMAGLQIRMR